MGSQADIYFFIIVVIFIVSFLVWLISKLPFFVSGWIKQNKDLSDQLYEEREARRHLEIKYDAFFKDTKTRIDKLERKEVRRDQELAHLTIENAVLSKVVWLSIEHTLYLRSELEANNIVVDKLPHILQDFIDERGEENG